MITQALWYSHEQPGDDVAGTPDELDAALDRAAALSRDDGWWATALIVPAETHSPVLYAGFARGVGVLRYIDGAEESFSQGIGSPDGEPLLYMYQQNDMEFPPNAEVPIAAVRAAVHEFAATGARPTGVQWQHWEPPETPGMSLPPGFEVGAANS